MPLDGGKARTKDWVTRGYAASALGELGMSDSEVVPILHEYAMRPAPNNFRNKTEVKSRAIASLIKIQQRKISELYNFLESDSTEDFYLGISILKELGDFGKSFNPLILDIAKRNTGEKRRLAMSALCRIRGHPKDTLSKMKTFLDDTNADFWVLRVYMNYGELASHEFQLIQRLATHHPVRSCRQIAIKTLCAISKSTHANELIHTLQIIADNDTAPEVRQTAQASIRLVKSIKGK